LGLLVFCAGCTSIESLGITYTPEGGTPVPTPTIEDTPEESIEEEIPEETPTEEITEIPTTIVPVTTEYRTVYRRLPPTDMTTTPTNPPTPKNVTTTPTKPIPVPTTPVPVSTTTVAVTPVITGPPPVELTYYVSYPDAEFKVDYPENWVVKNSTISTPSVPFIIGDVIRPNSRMVKFESPDSAVNFTIIISEFKQIGTTGFDPSMENCADSITQRFTDVSGTSAISNYQKKFTSKYQTPYVLFDATLKTTSKSYPYAYTEMDLVTPSHFYSARFNTPGTLAAYTDLKSHMFSTLVSGIMEMDA
jgi:hypothetical protein